MTRNLQSSWIRPVCPIVDYDFNEEAQTWDLPCENNEGCLLGDKLLATWMIGGELYGNEKIVVLCNFHAATYCRRYGVKMPNDLKDSLL